MAFEPRHVDLGQLLQGRFRVADYQRGSARTEGQSDDLWTGNHVHCRGAARDR